jgi:hypothetical protein
MPGWSRITTYGRFVRHCARDVSGDGRPAGAGAKRFAGCRRAAGKGLSKGIYSTFRWRSPLVARRTEIPWRKRYVEAGGRL